MFDIICGQCGTITHLSQDVEERLRRKTICCIPVVNNTLSFENDSELSLTITDEGMVITCHNCKNKIHEEVPTESYNYSTINKSI